MIHCVLVWFLKPVPLLENDGTLNQQLEACRSMPQHAAACRSEPKFSWGPLVLGREAARKNFFSKKNFSHNTYLKMISASWGIILSHICWGASEAPPSNLPVGPSAVPVSPSGVPVTGAQKGGGVPRKGARTPPPPHTHASQYVCGVSLCLHPVGCTAH